MCTRPEPGVVSYALTQGEIVVLHHGRPEDSYTPAAAPTSLLRAACATNDRTGDYSRMTRDELLAAVATMGEG